MKSSIVLFRIVVLVMLLLLLTGLQHATAGSLSPQDGILVNIGDDQYGTDPDHCALREAIQAANDDAAFGGCPAGFGTDTITLQNGVGPFLLSIAGGGGSPNDNGDLNIESSMTIQGYGWQATIIQASLVNPSRIFNIVNATEDISVTIRDLSLFNGDAGSEGGGTIANSESLLLEGVGIQDSKSDLNGGAIFSRIYGSGQALTIRDCTIINNTSGYAGGGIFSDYGEIIIENSYIANNTATTFDIGKGGGLYTSYAPVTIRRSMFDHNTSHGDGGNIYLSASGNNFHIDDSIITNGVSWINGGNLSATTLPDYSVDVIIRRSEISNGQANFGLGGGIYNDVMLTLENVTISGNQAQIGGGIYTTAVDDGASNLSIYRNITVTDNLDATTNVPGDGLYLNTSAPVNIYNSILAMNGPDTTLGLNCDCYRTISISSGYNLERGTSCAFTAGGDVQNSDPLLGPLNHNWGSSRTHALYLGSPAIDHGNNATCLSEDQRGWYRPVDGPDVDEPPVATCDIGAFEYGHRLEFLPMIRK
jgi:CSLREA domain-containing protein